jgi:nucleotide-binding universal stress UspA family protein
VARSRSKPTGRAFRKALPAATLRRTTPAVGLIVTNLKGPGRPRRVIAEGKIYREILKAAKTIPADLIGLGSHHAELKDYLLGPTPPK